MKPHGIGTIAVRAVGLACLASGLFSVLSVGITAWLSGPSSGGVSVSDARLDNHYYVIEHFHADLFVPGSIGLIIGVALLILSRRLGRFISRGIDSSEEPPNQALE